MIMPFRRMEITICLVLFCCMATTAGASPLTYTGVSLAAGEWGPIIPGKTAVYGKDYIYPTTEEIRYFHSKGMNLVRVAFRWERLQPTLNGPLDPAELGRLKTVVAAATSQGVIVLLDPHNSARYYKAVVGTPQLSDASFSDFWRRAAVAFKRNSRVWFGLTNEPHDMPTEQWVAGANAAIQAIRKTGARNFILVCGNQYSGAFAWNATWYGTPNDVGMLKIVDPGNNYAFEIHEYYDKDNSGTKSDVVSATVGVDRMTYVTAWAKKNHRKLFLGEFGFPNSPMGDRAATQMLNFVEANRAVWLGWAYWAAGPWWGDYMFSIEPRPNGSDAPQMAVLAPHLHGQKSVPPNP